MCMAIKISTKVSYSAYSARVVSKGCAWLPISNRLIYTCKKNNGDGLHKRKKLDLVIHGFNLHFKFTLQC